MDEFEAQLHRTWIQILIDANRKEVAALVIDGELNFLRTSWGIRGIVASLPSSAFVLAKNEKSISDVIYQSLQLLCEGHFFTENGERLQNLEIELRVKLLPVESDWQAIVRELIVNSKDSNQAVISEKVFARSGKDVLVYNEMKFASQSEIRIAQEFEKRKVLFFPLPLAVRRDTGIMYVDHKEVDFLVCKDGTWGILEVSFHPDRFEKDAEKDSWFKNSGILCIQHYSAERCYGSSSKVVDEFLDILSKHKR